jgi:hypothetical protein
MYYINKNHFHTYSYTIYGSVIKHINQDTLMWLTDITTDLLNGDDRRKLEVIEDTLINRKHLHMSVKIKEWTKL